jgi:hypothetical protein
MQVVVTLLRKKATKYFAISLKHFKKLIKHSRSCCQFLNLPELLTLENTIHPKFGSSQFHETAPLNI